MDLLPPSREKISPANRALVGCALGVAGMCSGLFYFIPLYEKVGLLWTMACAVLTGMYYTRYVKLKAERKRDSR